MGISFTDMRGIPDILSVDKQVLYFTNVPGGDGSSGRSLTLRHADATFPPQEIGQVIAKPNGWSRAFAGRRVQTNSMSVSFHEDRHGTSSKTLSRWMHLCSGSNKAGGKLSSEYAVTVELKAEDTMGKEALIYRINKVWPMRVQIPAYSPDASAPMKIEVDFSLDSMDLIGTVDVDGNATLGANVQSDKRLPDVKYTVQAEANLNLPLFNIGLSATYASVNAVIEASKGRNVSGISTLRGVSGRALQNFGGN